MPLRLDPGTMMKPKSKMKVFTKDETMSELAHSGNASALNKSARNTMLSHKNNMNHQQHDLEENGLGRVT